MKAAVSDRYAAGTMEKILTLFIDFQLESIDWKCLLTSAALIFKADSGQIKIELIRMSGT